jgi:hypothetical protein
MPSTVWTAIASKNGPLQTFVNPVFGTNYSTSDSDAWYAFLSQCQYMPKMFINEVSSGAVEFNPSPPNPSSVPIECNIYGINFPTYAFEDCNAITIGQLSTNEYTAKTTVSATCVNGIPAEESKNPSDMGPQYVGLTFSMNFNEQVSIPKKKGHFANSIDMLKGCCLPWENSSSLPSGCDFSLCDCYMLYRSSKLFPSATDSAWWGECSTNVTGYQGSSDAEMTKALMTTSKGMNCDWSAVITSEGNFEACTDWS